MDPRHLYTASVLTAFIQQLCNGLNGSGFLGKHTSKVPCITIGNIANHISKLISDNCRAH